MDFDLASYAMQMSPEQKQAMVAQMLRQRGTAAALQQANQQANRFNTLAAVSQMANNEGAANAATMAARSAQAQYKPVQMGQTGFALPSSGEFIESPMYTEQKDADRTLRQALATQRSDDARARMAQDAELARERLQVTREGQAMRNALGQTMAEIARMRLEGMQDKKAQADKDKADKETNAQVFKLSQFADKKQLPRLVSQARQLMQQLDTHGENTPGFSATEQFAQRVPFGDRMLSKEALDNQSAMQGIYNAFTRADAGLSQTLGEVQRQQLEMFNSPSTSARARAQIFRQHILPLIEQARGSVLGSVPTQAVEAYRNQQKGIGGNIDWMSPLTSKADSYYE